MRRRHRGRARWSVQGSASNLQILAPHHVRLCWGNPSASGQRRGSASLSPLRQALLAHRGSRCRRARRWCQESNTVLAFRRLAIIDLAAGDQPMATGAGQHLVFNGEIYNYREVRAELEKQGMSFRTASDTEVLLQTLALHGASGLRSLQGMFGFAFLDRACAGQLVLGRDRLGVKQLYHIETAAGFFFASEPKALLALPWVDPAIAEDQLPAYFMFRCVPSPATLFRGISPG